MRGSASVLFVRITPYGELCCRLKKEEANLAKTLSKKVKIVDRNGPQMQYLFTRSDPWAGSKCDRPNHRIFQLTEEHNIQLQA